MTPAKGACSGRVASPKADPDRPLERLYTIDEVAEAMAVDPRTVRRAIKRGAIKVLRPWPRIVRITETAYREFLIASGEQ